VKNVVVFCAAKQTRTRSLKDPKNGGAAYVFETSRKREPKQHLNRNRGIRTQVSGGQRVARVQRAAVRLQPHGVDRLVSYVLCNRGGIRLTFGNVCVCEQRVRCRATAAFVHVNQEQ
jgi:hypothetical protein